ncbi:MAG: MFS transporter [Acidimicrobiia bacterium]|nr:MFS transporter [Acidimicrobiia bacterium]
MSRKQSAEKIRLGGRYWRLWSASVISNLGDGVAQIAYPWLASAVTRNGILIALIAVAQRLPWLVFTLPAGVITDRVDRRKIMVAMDTVRTAVTLLVAVFVLVRQGVLPAPAEIAAGIEVATEPVLYVVLLIASLLFGFAEVLRDNAAQTILPGLVEPEGLEKANAQMWGVEMVANSFVGPPLGSLLIGVGFALPFFFDAGTFAVAAGLVFLITGNFRSREPGEISEKIDWWGEIREGWDWLWHHPLLRPMAVILGIMNGLFSVTMATFVLFAQEVLGASAFTFAIIGTGGAIGGLAATFLASNVSKRLGSGTSLYATLIVGAVTTLITGIASHWTIVWVMFIIGTFTAVLWNVITVSLRQTIIPDRLLGRVNSVYRFFAWGMMPLGLALGGLLVTGSETAMSRELALRMPWLVSAAAWVLLFVYAAPKLTTEKIEAARRDGIAAKEAAGEVPVAGETASEAISEAGVPGAPPPIEEGSDED